MRYGREISDAVDPLDLGWPAVAVRAGVGLVYSVLIEEVLHVQWEGALEQNIYFGKRETPKHYHQPSPVAIVVLHIRALHLVNPVNPL